MELVAQHQQHTPRTAPPEWFGTAFHTTTGMHHLDVRRSGDGILLTASPAEVDGQAATWQVRLRNENNGQELRELGTALASGWAEALGAEGPDGASYLLFLPDHPHDGVGTLARVGAAADTDGEVLVERSAERPMTLWSEAGENLLRIAAHLHPDDPAVSEPEECHPCPGCARPVYGGSPSPFPRLALCRPCADGSTLHAIQAAGIPVNPRQRALLETATR